jgi:exodeoxyribonuclease-1
LVQINRCPVLAPLSVLRPADQQRLGLDLTLLQSRGEQLANQQAQWQDKLEHIYGKDEFAPSEDPEQQLYDGFIGDRDGVVRASSCAGTGAVGPWPLDVR